MWPLFWELVVRRKNAPGEPTSIHALNECYDNSSTANALRRTYKNLSLLRGEGLRKLIVHEKDAGYLIPSDVPLVVFEEDS